MRRLFLFAGTMSALTGLQGCGHSALKAPCADRGAPSYVAAFAEPPRQAGADPLAALADRCGELKMLNR